MGARLFRALLRLLPSSFRDEFGEAMAENASARAAERSGGGAGSRFRFWAREYGAVLGVAASERWRSGGMTRIGDSRKGSVMGETFAREIRFAARRLRRAPGFAATALLTLALALGAVMTIWAVVRNVVVDPLPYAESDRLVVLEHGLPGVGAPSGVNITPGLYSLYRDDARRLEAAALTQHREYTLTGLGDAQRLAARGATPGLLRVLRIEPALGRWFGADAGREGGPLEVVLSHAAWTTRFGSDASVVGRTIQLSGRPWQVIGVLPPGLDYPDPDVMLWVPIAEPGAEAGMGGFNYDGIARLSEGADVESLRGELNALAASLPERYPDSRMARTILDEAGLVALPLTLKERTVGGVTRTMWVLLATVGLVLVVACANVANLMLVRSDARQTEVAVRSVLGAGRRGIAVLYLAESTLLTLAGGAAGMALAYAGLSLLRSRAPGQLPRVAEISMDAGVIAVGVAICVAVGLVLGLVPLLRGGGAGAAAVQEAGRRATAGGARVRARALLMTTQVALACVLLVASGLMVRSFAHLNRVDPGFDATNVLTFELGLPAARYPEGADAMLFHDAMLQRLAGLPGVRAADMVSCAPLAGWCWGDPLMVEGRENEGASPVVAMRRASTGYFATLDIAVRDGRAFEPADDGQPVAVINRALAQRYFPGEEAVGRRFRLLGREDAPWITIVGVVENTSAFSVTEAAPAPQVFFPAGSSPETVAVSQHTFTYVVRADGSPAALVPAIRAALRELDPDVALADVETLERALADSGARVAFTMVLLAVAAIATLLLGAIGIYGVISYTVTRRSGEIGIRLALGASSRTVVGMIIRQGGLATGAGLALGLVAAVAFARFMDALLFGVEATDPITFAAAALALGGLALVASWLPARRAASLDPMSALRAD